MTIRCIRTLWLLALALLVLVVLLVLVTPSGSDVQARVAADARRHHSSLLRPGEVPPQLGLAVVAVEDARFYQHHGIDVIGIARAILYDASHACGCQGGSTITQQLVKDIYLDGSDRGLNKLTGTVIAFKVETHISKQQVLADWLSVVPFGANLYGAGNASCTYFGRPLTKLDLAQTALIAGMPQGPSLYDPRTNPTGARYRRQEVLEAMVEEGYTTPEQAASAGAEPIQLDPAGTCG